jgi:hypothetical protein
VDAVKSHALVIDPDGEAGLLAVVSLALGRALRAGAMVLTVAVVAQANTVLVADLAGVDHGWNSKSLS